MFDTHCHLQDKRIVGCVGDIIDDAVGFGVRRMLCCGCVESDWADVARIGAAYGGAVTCAFGIHPWYVDDVSEGWASSLESFLEADNRAAVGEIGLDGTVESKNKAGQIEIFARQLEIAQKFKRPVSIHCRKAWGELLAILRDAGGLSFGGAIHSYSGSPEMVGELERLGLYISFSGSILNVGNKRAIESIKRVTQTRLLIETDSPDMLPCGVLGSHNVPANLCAVRDRAAFILGISAERVAALTHDNGLRLFGAPHDT